MRSTEMSDIVTAIYCHAASDWQSRGASCFLSIIRNCAAGLDMSPDEVRNGAQNMWATEYLRGGT